jgi:hypothetical protein
MSASMLGVSSIGTSYALMRTVAPTVGTSWYLDPGLNGSEFQAVVGAPPGTYVDDNGTIIVPTSGNGSAAWLRVWDGLNADIRWFGAVCDHVTDDYVAVYAALSLFTNGRNAIRAGVLDIGPGFATSKPLVYGGANSYAFCLKGSLGCSRGGGAGSYINYIGGPCQTVLSFYGANEARLEDVNIIPNGNCVNAFHVVADNTINTTLSAPVSAGQVVIATPAAMTWIEVGSYLGIDSGGPDFEIVYVTAISATTFTANFAKNHAEGAQVGGGPASSGVKAKNCLFNVPNAAGSAGMLIGNTTVGTVQVSEIVAEECYTIGLGPNSYAGYRVVGGGNVKNFTFDRCSYSGLQIPFAIEQGSGAILINRPTGNCTDTIFLHNGGALTVNGFEDESSGVYILRGGAGANGLWATFNGGSFQNILGAADLAVSYLGNLTMIGCDIRNQRTPTSFPIYSMNGIHTANTPCALTLIGCWLMGCDANSAYVTDSATDMVHSPPAGTKLSVLNCFGGRSGALVPLANLVPT